MRLFTIALVLLWLQLCWALTYTWRFGEYYAYGWFVPGLAAGLVWHRWQARIVPAGRPPAGLARPPAWVWWVTGAVLACLVPLRVVEQADPLWRPPLLVHALLVAGLSHLLLWQVLGRRVALALLPVTVFALTAVPYPWRLEQALIGKLSGLVSHLTQEAMFWLGTPVELRGNRLVCGDEMVEVADGCSGIRSLQSLVMVALFFGELWWLATAKRVAMVLVAVACAVGINTLRAVCLAQVHFGRGREAADALHDLIGHSAFFLSAGILFLVSLWMLRSTGRGRRVLRRTRVNAPASSP
jgi:exosortase